LTCNRTITARFISKELALFETGGQVFDDLNEAVSYAKANSQSKITLATDGSISGNYTIPAGITLLIPFDAAGTLYTDSPAAIRTAPASKPFRTLMMTRWHVHYRQWRDQLGRQILCCWR